ncbi:glycosyltransferase family 39 protein [Actinomadura verrucosospora]|uniref:Integral membrane protein n=1 Tax=Actinomadura verrucosospora TaxID=46165 RepID=A0A7D3ZKU3_ACTVE|nr:glycosyltransferase family 39 protein [Actinomadura verrucosospora]QKG20902.1 integral membrane protein [Actinomadura verrucosospora]
MPALLALAMGLWGAGRLPLWRDEAITSEIARRSAPDILWCARHIDAVHAAYYLFMHAVVQVLGAGELALRLPSVAAFAAAAAGVTVLGRKIMSGPAGLIAGLLYTGAPFASHYAHEARSYSVVAALTVWLAVLFADLAERGSRRRYAAYGAGIALLGLVHLFALLILPAHLATLLLTRRTRTMLRRWSAAAAGAVAAVSPLIALAVTQRNALDWLTRPGWRDALSLAEAFTGPPTAGYLLGAAMAAALITARRRGPIGPQALAVPWLLLPATVLLLASQFHPFYTGRYVIGSLPAMALLAAAGLARLPYRTWGVPLVAMAVLVAPLQVEQRRPENWWDDLRGAAAIIKRESRPGDAILFLTKDRRSVAEAYPDAFRRLRDVALRRTPARAGNFGGTEFAPAEIGRRLTGAATSRVWLLEGPWRMPSLVPQDRAKVDALQRHFRQAGVWRVRGITLSLFQR